MVVKKSDVYKPSEIAMAVLSKGRVRKVNNNGAVQACRVVDSHDIDKDMHAQLPPLRANFTARSHKPMSISTVAVFRRGCSSRGALNFMVESSRAYVVLRQWT